MKISFWLMARRGGIAWRFMKAGWAAAIFTAAGRVQLFIARHGLWPGVSNFSDFPVNFFLLYSYFFFFIIQLKR